MLSMHMSPPSTPTRHCRLPGPPARPNLSSRRTHSSETLLSAVARFSPEQPTYWPPRSSTYHDGSIPPSPSEQSEQRARLDATSNSNGVSSVARSISLKGGHCTSAIKEPHRNPTVQPVAQNRAQSSNLVHRVAGPGVVGPAVPGASSLLQRRKSSSASQRPNFALTDLKLELAAIPPPVVMATEVEPPTSAPVAKNEDNMPAVSETSASTLPPTVPLPLDVALPPPGESLDAHLAQLQLDDTIREEVIGESSAAVTPLPLDEDGKPISLSKHQEQFRPVIVERAFRSTKTYVATPLPDMKKRYFDSDEEVDEEDVDDSEEQQQTKGSGHEGTA